MTALILAAVVAACIEVDGDRILAKHLAAVSPELASVPADAAFGPAPRPGIDRRIRPAELQAFGRRAGVEIASVGDICVQGKLRQITTGEAVAALERVYGALTASTARVQVAAVSQRPVPAGKLIFPAGAWAREGTETIRWRGYVESSSGARYPVWASVHVEEGVTIQRPVRVATHRDVRAGDRVSVRAQVGSALLSLDAIAETSGSRGDFVTLKNPESGRKFHAKIAGPGEARIGGPSANRE